MAEGDSILRLARRMDAALGGVGRAGARVRPPGTRGAPRLRPRRRHPRAAPRAAESTCSSLRGRARPAQPPRHEGLVARCTARAIAGAGRRGRPGRAAGDSAGGRSTSTAPARCVIVREAEAGPRPAAGPPRPGPARPGLHRRRRGRLAGARRPRPRARRRPARPALWSPASATSSRARAASRPGSIPGGPVGDCRRCGAGAGGRRRPASLMRGVGRDGRAPMRIYRRAGDALPALPRPDSLPRTGRR